jgi:hypothetical protein
MGQETSLDGASVGAERQQFESWSVSTGLSDFRFRPSDNGYVNLFTDAQWQAWQARAALSSTKEQA